MKKGTTGLIVGLLVGVGLYLLLNRRAPASRVPPLYQNTPPRPAGKGEAFGQWVQAMIELYGQSKELFQPGGPFYRIPTKDIYDVVGEDPNRWDDYA